jgi:hypothetical protein
MSSACPHCGRLQQVLSAFCTGCGMATAAGGTGPRIVGVKDIASSKAGQSLQSEQLAKQERKAFITLLVLGILNLVIGGIITAGAFAVAAQGKATSQTDLRILQVMGLANCVIGGIYVGLALWARKSPLPATITGLVIYISLLALNGILAPESLLGGLIIKVIIIAALANGVSAGLKHRQLRQVQAD